MGKNIEKTFTKEAVHNNVVVFDEKPILQLIQDHLIREGQFDLHDNLAEESGVSGDPSLKKYFTTIQELVKCIDQRNLVPVIEWVQQRKAALDALSS
jgi:hypothetical protein